MNKIEAWKAEKDGLDVKADLARYAKEGWQSISEGDVQRLKWYGLFLRNPTPGYFMIRVRIPGGRLSAPQSRTLADIAASYGNGLLDITTRQQVQLRHLRIEQVPDVFARMEAVGLTALQTGMDNVRNVMTCPVAGLHPEEVCDTSSLVHTLMDGVLGNPAYSNLPRKFNVAISGCPDNCLHLETQDLALIPAYRIDHDLSIPGFNVLVGGKLGSGGYRIATPLNVFVTADEAAAVCRAIIEVFRDHGLRDSRNKARLAFLLEEWGEAQFRDHVESIHGRSLKPAGWDARKSGRLDHGGIYRQKQAGMNYVGLKVPVGRLKAKDLKDIVGLAERYGRGTIRIGANQAMIIPDVPDAKLGDLSEDPVLKRFHYNPSPVMKGLVSCVGNDYCNLAVIETKSQAIQVAKHLEAKLGAKLKPITMHWSGCPAGCGNHLVADVGLLGKKVKVDGKIVEAVDVYVGGRAGPDPKQAIKILEDVPCDRLPGLLEGLVPYHSRDKMHRTARRDMKPIPQVSQKE